MGDKDSFGHDEFRRVNQAAMNAIKNIKLSNFANYLFLDEAPNTKDYYKGRHFIESYFSSIYQFDQLKTGIKKIITPKIDGTRNLNISLGNEPFDILWSTGETTETISGLTAGSYSVTITDTEDCFTESSFEVIVDIF